VVVDYEDIARDYLESKPAFPSYVDPPPLATEDPDNWICVMESAELYGATLIHKSNFEVLSDYLFEKFPKDTTWGDDGCIAVRAFRNGKLTKACREGLEAAISVEEDYPILDEEDYSRRTYEAGLENIEWMGSPEGKYPKDWSAQVFRWLWDNEQEALEQRDEEDAYYPPQDAVARAIVDLGYYDKAVAAAMVRDMGTPCVSDRAPRSWPTRVLEWLQANRLAALVDVAGGNADEDDLFDAMEALGIFDEDKCAAFRVSRKLRRGKLTR
jgi:hypothetical protein